MTAATYCRTSLNYTCEAGPAPVEVDILDGRLLEGALTWETNGFELMRHRSAVEDWQDVGQIESVHYAEIAALARELTGCAHALVAGHISRDPEHAREHPDFAPIEFVHSDFTETYGDRIRDRYRAGHDELQATLARAGVEADAVLEAEHILILQFWRNVGPPRMDYPIAFCDATTVARDELRSFHVPSYGGGDFPFDTFGVTAPRDHPHRWVVYPDMAIDEVVAFRTYDSVLAEQHRPFWTPHSAFRDPRVPDGGPRRSSIELRATCLF